MIRLYNDATENRGAHAEATRNWDSEVGKRGLPHERSDRRESGALRSDHNTLIYGINKAATNREPMKAP